MDEEISITLPEQEWIELLDFLDSQNWLEDISIKIDKQLGLDED